MPWVEAVDVGIKIAGALQRAHDLGVLHRDVKPDNILMSEYGEPKLADFGIARLSGGYETRSGVITATVAHAAPELLEGRRPTPASDVYSLASTVYTLIAGHPPFLTGGEDESLASVVARIATQPPPGLSEQGVPEVVFAPLERAMRKDPDERTQTAALFGEELQTALREAGEPAPAMVVAPRDAAGTREPERARQKAPANDRRVPTRILVAAALVSVLVVGGLVFALSQGSGTTKGLKPTPVAEIPPMPTKLPGYARDGRATTATVRDFSGQAAFIDNFPWTMNGCNDAMNTVRWRSLVPSDVVRGGSTDQHGSETLQPSDLKNATSGRGGVIVMDSCQEPAFFLTHSAVGDTLVDIVVSVQHWIPTP